MRAALLTFVGTVSSANALKECLSIPSFPYYHVDKIGREGENFTCQPSKHPGAFYTNVLTDDKEWQCWDANDPIVRRTDLEAEGIARTKGFAGACVFSAYQSTTTPDDVPPCRLFLENIPTECSPGPEKYWGACIFTISQKLKCIPQEDTELVAGVAKGDCKAFSSHAWHHQDHGRGHYEEDSYNNVCRFEFDKPFKCPTVPTYFRKDASTCSASEQGLEVHPFQSACFSLESGTPWSCRADTQESSTCSWTYLEGKIARMKQLLFGGKFYNGFCLFPGSPGYDEARDWNEAQKPSHEALQAPAANLLEEGEGGLGRLFGFALIMLLLGVGGAAFFLWGRWEGARQPPLIGDGAEMSRQPSPGYLAD